ncbi:MAG: hypothetical protein LUD72_02610 [Bacteroidales bacterium]|nr:hypothetical protein [Bacteroidales bacterium]
MESKKKVNNIFGDIVLDREEEYDTQTRDCWAFSKRGVTKNGVELLLGNMIGGFPITINGTTYPCSEILTSLVSSQGTPQNTPR